MPDGVQSKQGRLNNIANLKQQVIDTGGRQPCVTIACNGLTNLHQKNIYCANCMRKLKHYGSTWHPGYTPRQLRAKRKEALAVIESKQQGILCYQRALDFVHGQMENSPRFEPAYRKVRMNTKDSVRNWFASMRLKSGRQLGKVQPKDFRREFIIRWICTYLLIADGECPRTNKFRRANLTRAIFTLGRLPVKVWPGLSEHDPWNNQRQSIKLTGLQRQWLGELAEQALYKMGIDWPTH